MSKCCGTTAITIVPFDKGDKTCKVKAANLKIFNTYILNTYQNDKNQNSVVLDDKTKKALGKEAVNLISIVKFCIVFISYCDKVFVNCYLTAKGVVRIYYFFSCLQNLLDSI
jgi:hypothetical protein